MKRIKFMYLATCLLVFMHAASIVYASSFVEILVDDNVSFQIPRNWVVLSDNKTITLNSIIESAVSVSSKVHFQANLKNDNGSPITTVQIYKWRSDFDQTNVVEMKKNDIDEYDQGIHNQMQSELKQVGGSITNWFGTKKLNINGLVALASEYSRYSKIAPFGHFRVQVLRIYSGEQSFSFVISYHEESSLQLRTIVDKVISTLCIVHPAYADNCEEFLSYSDQDRALAALEVLTNATPTQKLTIAIMIGEACKGNNPDFPRSEANKDAGKLLPYLRLKESKKQL